MRYNSHLRKNPLPEIEYFKGRYSYDPVSGHIYGRLRPNRPLGYLNNGYLKINFSSDPKCPRFIGAHVLAFALFSNRWPYMVDHINRIKSDNRWANLREVASHRDNMRNVHDSRAIVRSDNGSYRVSMVGSGASPYLLCEAYSLKRSIDKHFAQSALPLKGGKK